MLDEETGRKRAEIDAVPGEHKIIQIQLKISPPDQYIYSNVVGVSISPWDIRLNFGDYVPTSEPKTIKASVGLTMSPEHAASLAILLRDQVALYEEQFGEIRQKQWREMREEATRIYQTFGAPSDKPETPTE